MSEFSSSASPEPFNDLAHSIAELGVKVNRLRGFLARKVAREFMDEFGMSGLLDETGDAALESVLGTCVMGGITLGMKKETDDLSVEAEISRLNKDLPVPLRDSIGELAPLLVSRGVEFHRDELAQSTPKVHEWVEEFQLLADLDS